MSDERLTKIETTLWGAYGTNGMNSDVKRHSEQIGELYGRDESMRKEIDGRLTALDARVSAGFTSMYKVLISLMISVIVSAIGIIGTLIVVKPG